MTTPNPRGESIELIVIRNLLAEGATTAYMRGAAGQVLSSSDADPYAGRILALIAKARTEGNMNGYRNGIEVGGNIAAMAIKRGEDPYKAINDFRAALQSQEDDLIQDQPSAADEDGPRSYRHD